MRKQDTLRRVLSALRPYRLYLLLSLLAAALSVAAQLYVPILTGDAIARTPQRWAICVWRGLPNGSR